MRKFRRGILIGFLLIAVAGIFLRLMSHHPYYQPHYQPYPAVSNPSTSAVRAGNFAPGKLDAHYLKHGYQFGQITEEQYLEDAQALLDAPAGPDVLEKIRPNGDVEHYRVSTGEFAVMTRTGRIRTDFKTDYDYFISH